MLAPNEIEMPTVVTAVDAEVDLEILRTVPKQFAITDERSANWMIKKVVSARQYAERVKAWSEQELARAAREERTLMFLFGRQIEMWAQAEIEKANDGRKSLSLPAGRLGYRKIAAKLVIDNETTVLPWVKEHCPAAIVTVQKLSKSVIDDFVMSTGAIPDSGAHLEPESERFYIK